jgi:hypothetical protein
MGMSGLESLKAVDIFSVSDVGLNSGSSQTGYDNAAFQFQTKTDIIQATSFKAPMYVDSGSVNATFYIYNDSGSNTPGSTVMAGGSAVISNTTAADITFSFTSYYDLQPSTKYWYVFYKPNDGTVLHSKAGFLANVTKTEDYATLTGKNAQANYSAPPFSNWNTSAFPPNLVFAGTLSGVVNPVPEPSTYALGAIATGVMAAVARRRKAKRVQQS